MTMPEHNTFRIQGLEGKTTIGSAYAFPEQEILQQPRETGSDWLVRQCRMDIKYPRHGYYKTVKHSARALTEFLAENHAKRAYTTYTVQDNQPKKSSQTEKDALAEAEVYEELEIVEDTDLPMEEDNKPEESPQEEPQWPEMHSAKVCLGETDKTPEDGCASPVIIWEAQEDKPLNLSMKP